MDTVKTQIKREFHLDHAPDEAYKLITEKDNIARWYCDAVEVREGGLSFKWKMQDGGTAGFDVDILEAVAGERFVYRSGDEYPIITTFMLQAHNGGTKVTMTEDIHPDTPDLEALHDEHVGGWDWFLSRLKTL